PQVGDAGAAVVAHAPGDVDAPREEVHVPAVVLPRVLDRPPEEAAVELTAPVGIRGPQGDPAGGPDGGVVALGHGGSFDRVPMGRERSADWTAAAPRTHRWARPAGSRITTGMVRSVFSS